MASTTTETMVKMVETLPPELHERVLEHMREFIEDILEDAKWSESFAKSQNRLAAAASQAAASQPVAPQRSMERPAETAAAPEAIA